MTKQQKINEWYITAAQRLLGIDETNEGQLYCNVPSESNPMALKSGKWYRVDVDQSSLVPISSSCNCKGFEVRKDCKHCLIVNTMFQRIYKSNAVKAEAKQQQASQPVVSSPTTSYTMSDALYAKLASLNEVKTTKVEDAKVVDEKRDEYWDDMRACWCFKDTGKPTGSLKDVDTGSAKVSWDAEEQCFVTALNNAPQSNAMPAWLSILPSRQQQKQQEALAS